MNIENLQLCFHQQEWRFPCLFRLWHQMYRARVINHTGVDLSGSSHLFPPPFLSHFCGSSQHIDITLIWPAHHPERRSSQDSFQTLKPRAAWAPRERHGASPERGGAAAVFRFGWQSQHYLLGKIHHRCQTPHQYRRSLRVWDGGYWKGTIQSKPAYLLFYCLILKLRYLYFKAIAHYEQAADYYKGEESNRYSPDARVFLLDAIAAEWCLKSATVVEPPHAKCHRLTKMLHAGGYMLWRNLLHVTAAGLVFSPLPAQRDLQFSVFSHSERLPCGQILHVT